jgi:hypothetical protein
MNRLTRLQIADQSSRWLVALSLLGMVATMGCDRSSGGPTSETKAGGAARPTAKATGPEEAGDEPSGEDKADWHAEVGRDSDLLWLGRVDDGRLRVRLGEVDFETSPFADAGTGEVASTRVTPTTLPPRYRHLETWQVLTEGGILEVETERLERSNTEDPWYFLESERAEALAGVEGPTLAAPPGRIADDAMYRRSEPEDPDEMPTVRNALGSRVEDRLEEPFESFTGHTPNYDVYDGDFPGPHEKVVNLVVLTAPSARGCHLCALVLVDDEQEVTATIDVQTSGLGTPNVLAFADPSGDGDEGFLYDPPKREAKMRWIDYDDEGRPVEEPLGGVREPEPLDFGPPE